MPNRVMIFIDGSNVYHSIKDAFHRTDLDYSKLAMRLTDARDCQRTYFYGALVDQFRDPKGFKDQQRFLTYLRNLDYFEVRMGSLVRTSIQSNDH